MDPAHNLQVSYPVAHTGLKPSVKVLEISSGHSSPKLQATGGPYILVNGAPRRRTSLASASLSALSFWVRADFAQTSSL